MSSANRALEDLERLYRLTEQAMERLKAGDLETMIGTESERRELMATIAWESLKGDRSALKKLQELVALDTELRQAATAVRDTLGQRLAKLRRGNSAVGVYNRIDG
ncbi:hypothetical protein GCM10011348_32290 [Marinobacterium nitratireducens]|uniref:Flagellar protein FliT n=1 Tax=Marinobacterium nitratireducens TaxID=518897 RepID=A0A917ZKE4_9GAMM|nr:hypothetical protein [Marinobacterium nitratireducens]GGO84926.1 hypothetical protein GCM10011348_32290 [Marinobacterium nitratireducens]